MKIQIVVTKSIKAKKFFDAAFDTLVYLYQRWQDERGYEAIEDYAKPLSRVAKKVGVKILRMTGRPFGCVCKVDDRTYHFTVNSRTGQYRRLA